MAKAETRKVPTALSLEVELNALANHDPSGSEEKPIAAAQAHYEWLQSIKLRLPSTYELGMDVLNTQTTSGQSILAIIESPKTA